MSKNATKRDARRRSPAPSTEGKKLSAVAEQPPLPLASGDAPAVKVSTFGELGNMLPVGYLQGGQLHRAFAFKPYRMKEERELEGLKGKTSQSMAEFVIAVLAHMLTSLGPWPDFQALSEAERRLILGSMYVGDVHYLFVSLRIAALGKEIAFPLKCPACRHGWKWFGDLATCDVVVVEDPSALTWRHDLRAGLQTPKGSVSTLYLQPPRWHALTSLRAPAGGTVNAGDLKLRLIASAVRGAEGAEFDGYAITPEILEQGLTKGDMERLNASVDGESPGPDLELEAACPACSHEFSHPLNWSWDFFFTASSL